MIIHGDCIEEMKKLPENSIDAIITDPPYGLGFMNKEWDNPNKERELIKREQERSKQRLKEGSSPTSAPFSSAIRPGLAIKGAKENKWFQEWSEKWAKEAMRILKPGGYMLVCCATRMYHRMVCGIEDAGFEIRDTIMWLYGSGFPKSLNIGKQIDKLKRRDYILEAKKLGIKPVSNASWGDWTKGEHSPSDKYWEEFKKAIPKEQWEMIERKVIGQKETGADNPNGETLRLSKNTYEKDGKTVFDITKGNSEYEGWGTALKPAVEPIVVARKPLSEKNVALNVLKWGTGGINIDATRIEYIGMDKRVGKNISYGLVENKTKFGQIKDKKICGTPKGRFPANIILDEEAGKMLDEQSGILKKGGMQRGSIYKGKGSGGEATGNVYGAKTSPSNKGLCQGEYGASRFFYCAKASKSERNLGCEELESKRGGSMETNTTDTMQLGGASLKGKPKEIQATKNNHPTVKPIKLMEYLIKLVSKEGAVVLDPFGGSGTTMIACIKNNRKCILIEKEEDYIKIANARIKPFLEQKRI